MIEAEYSFSDLVKSMTNQYMLAHSNELNLPAELRNAAPIEPVVAIIYYQNGNITLHFYYSGDLIYDAKEGSYFHRGNLDDDFTLDTALEFLHPSQYYEDRADPNYILAVEDKDKQLFGYHISADDMLKCLM